MRFAKMLAACMLVATLLAATPQSMYAQSKEPPTEAPAAQPQPDFWSNTAGVYFDAGTHNGSRAYISFISVAYTDGSNEFQTSFTPWTYSGTLVDGGRRSWTLSRGIRIKFYLDGYGNRECTVSTSSRYAVWSYATVTYLGNNSCNIK
jgi:hypothetical protein